MTNDEWYGDDLFPFVIRHSSFYEDFGLSHASLLSPVK